MIRLFVYAQDNNDQYDRELDTTGTRLQLRIAVADLRDITERKSPHTLTFKLPMTENNNVFFTHYYDANVTGTAFNQARNWSPYVKTKAEVLDDNIPVMRGQMQLLSVDITNQEYEVIILAAVADVIFSIKGKTWFDVVGIQLDHESTAQNVIDSWNTSNDITNGAGNGVVVYPIVDTGNQLNNGWRLFLNAGNAYDINGVTAIQAKDLRPSVQVKWLIERIFNSVGYAVSSDFFQDDRFSKLYTSVGLHNDALVYRALYGANVGRSTNLSVAANVSVPLAFSLETGDFYDPDGLFSGGTFIAPAPGTYSLNVTVQFQSGGTGEYNFSLIGQGTGNTYTFNNVFTNGTPHTISVNWNVEFAAQGNTMTFYVVHNSTSVLTVLAGGSSILLNSYDIGGAGQTLDMAEMLMEGGPEVFLKEIITRYNLAFIEEELNPSVLICEPWAELVEAGSTDKDWTNKIDRSDIFTTTPTTDLQKAVRRFTDAKTERFIDRNYDEGFSKGHITITNDNVFTTETQVIESKFVNLNMLPLPQSQTSYTTQSDVLLSGQYSRVSQNESPYFQTEKTAPWIAYYLGTKQVDNNDATVTITIETTTSTVFPLFSVYSEAPVTPTTYSTMWGPDSRAPLSPYIGEYWYVLNHLYRTYYQVYIESFTNREAKILKCKVYLTAKDVSELKWNDKIFIDSQYWRVLSISDYSVGDSEPVTVELIKDYIGAETDCGLNWVSSNADGTTNWEDETGSVPPTEACCNANGLHWDSTTLTCRWARPADGHSDEDTSVPSDTNPTSPILFPNGFQGVNLNSGGVSVSEINYPVTVTADNSGFFEFTSNDGIVSSFNLALANTYQINLRVIGQEQTTVGVFGDSAIAEFSMAYRFNGNLTRQVGTTQTVMSTGDWTIGVQAQVGGTSTSPSLSFQVAGLAGQTVVYSGIISVVVVDLSNHYIPVFTGDALWQDANNIAFQNGDEMLWN
tara:strand:- start:1749 stop:4643 length:2895 start_codon:yes stop_codon:yes gene_type:complete